MARYWIDEELTINNYRQNSSKEKFVNDMQISYTVICFILFEERIAVSSWSSFFFQFFVTLWQLVSLTLCALCISESCIKIKINLNFVVPIKVLWRLWDRDGKGWNKLYCFDIWQKIPRSTEAESGSPQTSKMESFAPTVNGLWVKVRYFLTFSICASIDICIYEFSYRKLFLLTNYYFVLAIYVLCPGEWGFIK